VLSYRSGVTTILHSVLELGLHYLHSCIFNRGAQDKWPVCPTQVMKRHGGWERKSRSNRPRSLWDDYEGDDFTVPMKVEVVTMLIFCKLFVNDSVIAKIIPRRW